MSTSSTPTQIVTPELRDWIVAQAAAGHPPEIVVEAMKASGWEEPVARIALATDARREGRGGARPRRRPGRCPAATSAPSGRACPPATARSRC